MEGLRLGQLQTVGTDHCAFFYDGTRPITYEGNPVAILGKELGRGDFTKIPNGLPGIEDRMQILWTHGVGQGRTSANQFVALTATNPAKAFGLYPRKGTLVPGSDADLVIWNPSARRAVRASRWHQRTDYNLYEGWELVGVPGEGLPARPPVGRRRQVARRTGRGPVPSPAPQLCHLNVKADGSFTAGWVISARSTAVWLLPQDSHSRLTG